MPTVATSSWGDANWGEILYGDQFVIAGPPPPPSGNHAAAWWWSGAAARMINDAGFLLLVEPHLERGEGYDEGEIYTGERKE